MSFSNAIFVTQNSIGLKTASCVFAVFVLHLPYSGAVSSSENIEILVSSTKYKYCEKSRFMMPLSTSPILGTADFSTYSHY